MNQNQPQNTQIEAAKAANVACKVKLPDGSQRDAVAGVTTPHDVALGISKSLAKDIVVAKVCERERGKEKEREREERETKKSREGRERRTNGGLDLLLPPRFLQPRPQPPLLKSHFTPPHRPLSLDLFFVVFFFFFILLSREPKVDGKDWDLARPLESSCALELFKFDSAEGRHAFWHSSAHVLGEALEQSFGVKLTIGPAVAEGFYYDCHMGGDRSLSDADFPVLDKAVQRITAEKQRFERAVVSREEALGMFAENKFKAELIEGFPAGSEITLYRCGPMVDLCTGPHLPHTGYLKAAKVTSASCAFWRADAKREALQRVYGITFPEKAQLAEYEHRRAEAEKRDHRKVATAQDLVLWHPLSPGCAFMMPAGARVYNELIRFMQELYWEHEFDEVVTPNLFNFDLWHTSGHAAHYKENMFMVEVEKQVRGIWFFFPAFFSSFFCFGRGRGWKDKNSSSEPHKTQRRRKQEFGLKPMNCPGHCLLFASRARSYRDLPLRMADFGVLHRNEFSGALSGLTRVRRFQQDDAHIFCRPDQVAAEVSMCLRMLDAAYEVFGLDYSIALSTRPEGYLGEEFVPFFFTFSSRFFFRGRRKGGKARRRRR